MRVSSVLVILLLLCGCNRQVLEPTDFISWINGSDNGLVKNKETSELLIEVMYKPIDYMVLQEMEGSYTDKKLYDSLYEKFEGFDYYNVRLSAKNKKTSFIKAIAQDDEQFFRLKEYFYFHFDKDIYLEAGDERIPCILYHFEDAYELSKHETMAIGFKTGEKYNDIDKKLVFNSDVLRTGIVKILFTKNDFQSIPVVKIN